ncbi:MAG TPA: hypothetical protein VMB34_05215 [Acetobacteraceae bacterium]|nr:hypothetical protein [Acetobacteraceae bacterium]
MVAPANDVEFESAAYEMNLAQAAGRQGGGPAIGGMISPEVVEVPAGSLLCRITHSALPAEVNLASPWWAQKADFTCLLGVTTPYSADFRDTLRDSLALSSDFVVSDDKADQIRAKFGRDALATLKNFSNITPYDRIFETEVTSNLLAFSGIGQDVTDTCSQGAFGILRTWKASATIKQLYIPGLRDSDGRLSRIGRTAMHFRRSSNLVHWIERELATLDPL